MLYRERGLAQRKVSSHLLLALGSRERMGGGAETYELSGAEGEPEGGLSPSRSLSFASSRAVSLRSSMPSSTSSSFSLGSDTEWDDDIRYRVMMSECEEIPSFRWLPSPLRWWSSPPRDGRTGSLPPSTVEPAISVDWKRLLPSDYKEMLSRAVSPVRFSSMEQLYLRLCKPLLIDRGKKSFALERSSGKKCFMLSARELVIAWGDTPKYWKWVSLPESRFSKVAGLLEVCWLDIRGKIDCSILSQDTNYAAYLIFKLAEGSRDLGFPQETSLQVGSHTSGGIVCLQPEDREEETWEVPRRREDGWVEVKIGEFFNDRGDDGKVDMRFMEIKILNWKKGLIVEGIEVRPS